MFISILHSEKTLNIFDKQIFPPKKNKLNLCVNLISISLFNSFEIISNKVYICSVIMHTFNIIKILL